MSGFTPYACWRFLREPANRPAVLRATWVRPEDLHHYDGLFDTVKLATRLHARPWAVVGAYVRRRWRGSLLDLLEPGYSRASAPNVIDNSKFPDDWFDRTSTCGRRCHTCTYCAETLGQTLISLAPTRSREPPV